MGLDATVKRAMRVLERQDRDPSLWPVMTSDRREFMVDCKVCGNRMAQVAMKSHARRCSNKG